ncbi:trihelix transcription factor ENAP1-like [Lycium barbarum]|uniref:trihelix transcription factor ENAP1-like n=1 Tax=Lycium barbarum TaxID=112863 RepID=UPI00293F0CA6|nr:trihelix transcription factor ENAP1-like [Lycium barbarum]
MGEITESSTHITAPFRPLPFREDCWSEDATWTLVDAWGRRYLELNRGNLRQKDWQDVANSVNALHGHTKKTHRTDVQCKNRIDTLKKKYKAEKAKIVESNGTLTSSWPFFQRLDMLIGNSDKKITSVTVSTPPLPMGVPLPYRRPMTANAVVTPVVFPEKRPANAVVTPVILPQKRQLPAFDESYFRRNYSAVAAAAAAGGEEDCDDDDDDVEEDDDVEVVEEDSGIRKLAKAIERFGEIYERVEGMKQRQMVELEKQRMQFAKDLEVQRMQLFMDTQVQLEKIKHTNKRSGSDDVYS